MRSGERTRTIQILMCTAIHRRPSVIQLGSNPWMVEGYGEGEGEREGESEGEGEGVE